MSKYRPARTSAGMNFSGLHIDGRPGLREPDDDDAKRRKKARSKAARKARRKSR